MDKPGGAECACEGLTSPGNLDSTKEASDMREDFHIKQVSEHELWRLLFRFLGEAEVEALSHKSLDRLRIAQKRARLCAMELQLRGVQLQIDLRQREQEPGGRQIDR